MSYRFTTTNPLNLSGLVFGDYAVHFEIAKCKEGILECSNSQLLSTNLDIFFFACRDLAILLRRGIFQSLLICQVHVDLHVMFSAEGLDKEYKEKCSISICTCVNLKIMGSGFGLTVKVMGILLVYCSKAYSLVCQDSSIEE